MEIETDNTQLEELFLADQDDRKKVYSTPQDIKELADRDAMRRAILTDLIRDDQVKTPNDLYNAAVLFLHGDKPHDFLSGHRLATLASIEGHRLSRYLLASSLDRLLMSLNQAQVYSTQYELNAQDNKYVLRLPVDDKDVLSFERKFLNVPSMKIRLEQLNRRIK